jgi:hypothetical protein
MSKAEAEVEAEVEVEVIRKWEQATSDTLYK